MPNESNSIDRGFSEQFDGCLDCFLDVLRRTRAHNSWRFPRVGHLYRKARLVNQLFKFLLLLLYYCTLAVQRLTLLSTAQDTLS